MIRNLKSFLESSVFSTLLSKSWYIIAGPVTALIIAVNFSSVLQGYYFTFNNLLSLQLFIELGLGIVIQFFCSHEWSNLSIDNKNRITGDEKSFKRLSSLSKIAFKWFFKGGIVAFIILYTLGFYFFEYNTTSDISINWELPWLALCVLTSINIAYTPFYSILEGCNQIKSLYKLRLFQGIFFTSTLIISILLGFQLWAPCFATLASILVGTFFIYKKYFYFFYDLLKLKNTSDLINWKKDLLPMQWKIAISWISNYFCFYLFTPLLFMYQGPEIAGKFGMSWAIMLSIGSFSSSWIIANTPKYSILIAKNDYVSLDKLNLKMFKISSTAMFLILISFLGFVMYSPVLNLNIIDTFISRLLDPLTLGVLAIGQFFFFISTPFATYLRSHKKEPLLFFNLTLALIISLMTYYFSKNYSVFYVVLSYATVSIIDFSTLLIIWKKLKIIYKLKNQ